MSKQDGYSPRTAADLERKYNFGKSFAEIYNLVSDARNAAIEAKNAYEGLSQSEIFNLLTDFGQSQGVYRDDTGNVYMNASYIQTGVLQGDKVKVAAAIVEGELSAATIKADKVSGGELDFNKVTAKNLTIGNGLPDDLAKVSDILTKTSQLTNDSMFIVNDVVLEEYSKMTGITEIIGGVVTADFVRALGITANSLVSQRTDSFGNTVEQVVIANGMIEFDAGTIVGSTYYGSPVLSIAGTYLHLRTQYYTRFYDSSGGYWELNANGMYYYESDGAIDFRAYVPVQWKW